MGIGFFSFGDRFRFFSGILRKGFEVGVVVEDGVGIEFSFWVYGFLGIGFGLFSFFCKDLNVFFDLGLSLVFVCGRGLDYGFFWELVSFLRRGVLNLVIFGCERELRRSFFIVGIVGWGGSGLEGGLLGTFRFFCYKMRATVVFIFYTCCTSVDL